MCSPVSRGWNPPYEALDVTVPWRADLASMRRSKQDLDHLAPRAGVIQGIGLAGCVLQS